MNGQAVETVANSRLADTAPALAGAAVVLAIVLPMAFGFVLLMVRSMSREMARAQVETAKVNGDAQVRVAGITDQWIKHHEQAEAVQFADFRAAQVVAVRTETKLDSLHDKFDDLADRIDRRDEERLLGPPSGDDPAWVPPDPRPDPKAPRGR